MRELTAFIRESLLAQVDEAYREGSRNYFKEPIEPLGVRAALVKKLAAQVWRRVKPWSTSEVWQLCRMLWQTGTMEEGSIATTLAARMEPRLTPDDFDEFEAWLQSYVRNWAHCDDLCTHALGRLLLLHKELLPRTDPWAVSGNRWLRRASAVALIPLAKSGALPPVFERADALLSDDDDLVRKGLGWMLKEAGRNFPAPVSAYLLARREQMARVALRIAVEKLPEDRRRQCMARP